MTVKVKRIWWCVQCLWFRQIETQLVLAKIINKTKSSLTTNYQPMTAIQLQRFLRTGTAYERISITIAIIGY